MLLKRASYMAYTYGKGVKKCSKPNFKSCLKIVVKLETLRENTAVFRLEFG